MTEEIRQQLRSYTGGRANRSLGMPKIVRSDDPVDACVGRNPSVTATVTHAPRRLQQICGMHEPSLEGELDHALRLCPFANTLGPILFIGTEIGVGQMSRDI